MVIHELVTNAAKHGALSTPGGRVAVTWQVSPDSSLHLHWQESGGPRIESPPLDRGFGSTLMQTAVRSQLGGDVAFSWNQEGLVCELTIGPGQLGEAPKRAS